MATKKKARPRKKAKPAPKPPVVEEAPEEFVKPSAAPERRFRCIKEGLYFINRTWKKGEIYIDPDDPADGKGNSLLKGPRPAFEEV